MRLHRLEFQAIGPFAGRHVIDFDALGGDGLFLLEGPTGSGKSTIIDALTFALFGNTAAESTGESRIRSTHVGPEVETYVDLVMTVARGPFRVRRTPAYQRPKLRGTGTTEEKPSATLWRLTPEEVDEYTATGTPPRGTHLASGAREVGIEAAALVGLTKEQFAQTVILPQGEFARFLRSTSEEREEILERIFATELYQAVQEALADRSRAHRKAIDEASIRLRGHAERYAARLATLPGPDENDHDAGASDDEADADGMGSDGADESVGVDGGPPPPSRGERLAAAVALVVRGDAQGTAEIAALVAEVDAAASTELAWRRTARERAGAAADAARAHLDAQRGLAEALTRRSALLARSVALAVDAEDAERDAARLHAAERSARTAPSLSAAAAAAQSLERALEGAADALGTLVERAPTDGALEELAASARAALEAAGPGSAHGGDEPRRDPIPLTEAAAQVRTHADAVTAQRGALTDALELEAGIAARRGELEERTRALRVRREDQGRRREQLEARPAHRAGLTEQLTAARSAAAARPGAATAEQEARRRLEAARRAARAQEVVNAARKGLAAATSAAASALATEADLRRRRIEGIAGELAVTLCEGEPCAVCGSTSHPAPARPGPDQPTHHQITRAESARARAEATQAEARAALATAEANREHWSDAAEGLDVEAATAAHAAATQELAAARAAEEEAAEVEAEREAFDTHTAQLQAEAEALGSALTEEATRLEAAEQALATDRATVDTARGEAPTVAARAARLDAEAAAARTLAQACEAAVSGLLRDTEAARQLTEVLAAEGFADAVAARAAALPREQREGLERRLRERASEEQRVSDGLAAEDIAELTGEETTDVPGALALSEAAAAAGSAAAEAFGAATIAAEAAAAEGAMLLGEARAQITANAEAAPYVRLAQLATAGDASLRRIPLSTFVLMRRFEDMVAAANSRLVAMSSGRYELARTDREEGQRARRIGLGLTVLDHETGTSRAPNSLSGGETFYVSLSLALGLADVVRAETGGVELGTLLIDEGFGSLDQETLDIVMAELLRLRDAGRTVGLVSHVTEMQRMIQDKIEVRRVPGRGSTLTVNWMGA